MLNHISEYKTEYSKGCYNIVLEISDRVVDLAYDEVTDRTALELAENYIAYAYEDFIIKSVDIKRDEERNIFIIEIDFECD